MLLTINTDRQRLCAGLNNPSDRTGSLVEVKRGDNPSFDHIFCHDFGPAYEPDATVAFTDSRLTAKAVGDLGSPGFVISAFTFTKTGTGADAVYSLAPSLNTVALNDLFITGGVIATPADATARKGLTGLVNGNVVRQVDEQDYYVLTNAAAPTLDASWSTDEPRLAAGYVDLAAETEWVQGGVQTSTLTYTLRVWDDVSKGNEGIPPDATPAYPLPAAVVTAYPLITGLTGGSPAKLDGITTAGGVAPTVIVTPNLADAKLWQLTAGTDATAAGIQRPADYAASTNERVWKSIL